jgi:hypothetical protein
LIFASGLVIRAATVLGKAAAADYSAVGATLIFASGLVIRAATVLGKAAAADYRAVGAILIFASGMIIRAATVLGAAAAADFRAVGAACIYAGRFITAAITICIIKYYLFPKTTTVLDTAASAVGAILIFASGLIIRAATVLGAAAAADHRFVEASWCILHERVRLVRKRAVSCTVTDGY